MKETIQYIVNEKGSRTSVLLPMKKWNEINTSYQKMVKKMEVLTGIKDAMDEIKRAKKSGKKLDTLSSFLNEL